LTLTPLTAAALSETTEARVLDNFEFLYLEVLDDYVKTSQSDELQESDFGDVLLYSRIVLGRLVAKLMMNQDLK
jgi:hypothetical protein